MSKSKRRYVCQACGSVTHRWQGQCPDCAEWNSLAEERPATVFSEKHDLSGGGRAVQFVALDQPGEKLARRPTGLAEFDRALGGGLVTGSAVLLGGDPGIGKSTLLLQAAAALGSTRPVLYATGEESLQQVALRARRLGLAAPRLRLLAETSVERIIEESTQSHAEVLIVDSIQTMATETSESAPGAVSQLRESTAALLGYAKSSGTAVLLIGHVTKEGVIAGPRVLEHMVDTVLYFESDSGSRYRVVRAVKNRFGAANEIGVFAMVESGLKEVRNPSAIFLSRHDA